MSASPPRTAEKRTCREVQVGQERKRLGGLDAVNRCSVRIIPAGPPCVGPRCRGRGLLRVAMDATPLTFPDCLAASRDRSRAFEPVPPALPRSCPTEHRRSPPYAPAPPIRASQALPFLPKMQPRRNDRQRGAPSPYRCRSGGRANRVGSAVWRAPGVQWHPRARPDTCATSRSRSTRAPSSGSERSRGLRRQSRFRAHQPEWPKPAPPVTSATGSSMPMATARRASLTPSVISRSGSANQPFVWHTATHHAPNP